MTAAQVSVVALAALAANLPFFSRRIFCLFPLRSTEKGMAWRLLEVFVLYLFVGGVALVLESRAHGTPYPQAWEFYAITFCLFVVLAYPGFVYRYLWRRH